MDTSEHTPIPYAYHKAEAAQLRREAMVAMWGQLGRLWRWPARRHYGIGSGLATGQ